MPEHIENETPSGFRTLLGYRLAEWRDGFAIIEIDIDERHLNRSGVVHGGVYATLIDAAGGYAGCFSHVPGPARRAFTLSLNTNFVGTVRSAPSRERRAGVRASSSPPSKSSIRRVRCSRPGKLPIGCGVRKRTARPHPRPRTLDPAVRGLIPAGWEHFDHMADMGLRGHGATAAEAFQEIAKALTAVIAELDSVRPETAVDIRCQAPNLELLLVDWLNSLIYEMSTRGMLFSRFEVAISGFELTGRAWGEPIDLARHHPAVEVKGATLTALKMAQFPDGRWMAQCVADV